MWRGRLLGRSRGIAGRLMREGGFHLMRQVAEMFTKHCYMEWRDNVWRDCYADEQYLGTLLASKVPALALSLSRSRFPRA